MRARAAQWRAGRIPSRAQSYVAAGPCDLADNKFDKRRLICVVFPHVAKAFDTVWGDLSPGKNHILDAANVHLLSHTDL